MTGEEHYLAAEELVNAADGGSSVEERTELLRAAQVHATLAMAHAYLPVNVTLEAPTTQEQTR